MKLFWRVWNRLDLDRWFCTHCYLGYRYCEMGRRRSWRNARRCAALQRSTP